jgi:hypothetical protein
MDLPTKVDLRVAMSRQAEEGRSNESPVIGCSSPFTHPSKTIYSQTQATSSLFHTPVFPFPDLKSDTRIL